LKEDRALFSGAQKREWGFVVIIIPFFFLINSKL
jgi:hypothetical protein